MTALGIGLGVSLKGKGTGSTTFPNQLVNWLEGASITAVGSPNFYGGVTQTLQDATTTTFAYQPYDALVIAFVDAADNPPSFAVTGPLTVGNIYYVDVSADIGFATYISYQNTADITEQGNLQLLFNTGQLSGTKYFRMWYADPNGVPSTYSNTLTHTYSLAGGDASILRLVLTTTGTSTAGQATAFKLILTKAA